MNAAAKYINQANIFNGQLTDMRLSKSFFVQFILVAAVLINALVVVYVTNGSRMTFSELQLADQKHHQLELQWGQLLLEQASLSTPARVQNLAISQLHMLLPADKQAHLLQLK